jgi:outer membrane protein assembly factor BamB
MYRPSSSELGPSYSSFVLFRNQAYSGSISGSVVGFDLLTGKKVADIPVRPGVPDELFDSGPVLDGKYLYIGSTGGNVYCVDLERKQVVWSYALQPGFIFSTPVVWGDRLLVASSTGTVYELQRPEAQAKLDFEVPSAVSVYNTTEMVERPW